MSRFVMIAPSILTLLVFRLPQVCAVIPACALHRVGPAGASQALTQVIKGCLWDVYFERLDTHVALLLSLDFSTTRSISLKEDRIGPRLGGVEKITESRVLTC